MKRRKLLIGLGSLAAGSAAAMGTGAFTSADVDRTVAGKVVGDGSAYVKMRPTGQSNGAYAEKQGGQLVVNFEDNGTGSGLNQDSVWEFDKVIKITNQGTEPVDLWITDTLDRVSWYLHSNPSNTIEGPNNAFTNLAVGHHKKVGITLDLDDYESMGDIFTGDDEFTVHAEASSTT